jgi:hydroxypyruvate reductase
MQDLTNDREASARLLRWYRAGLAAIDPVVVTREAIRAAAPPASAPALLALGKAASSMVTGAVEGLAHHHLTAAATLAITDHPWPDAPTGVEVLLGDHPVPGPASHRAAAHLGAWVAALPRDIPVIVLLSGGTSALIAAPLQGIRPEELDTAFTALHAFGLDIIAMNALRRRLTRWSGGRLAAALAPRPVTAYVISDVPDNLLGAIGSGPLVGGELHAESVIRLLASPERLAQLPRSVIEALAIPAPQAPPLPHTVVSDGQQLAAAIADAAAAEGATVVRPRERLTDDTTDSADLVATAIARAKRRRTVTGHPGILVGVEPPEPVLFLWEAEMTVTLPPDHGIGGRLQQFAVELSLRLERLARLDPQLRGPLVLAASSDGRDGPTDAAAAFASAAVPGRIRETGDDPDRCVAARDTHEALERAGALVHTGPTGTNVADVVLAILRNWY